MEWGAIITAVCGLIVLLIRTYSENKKKDEENAADEHRQKFKKALGENDSQAVDALAADQHDRVREALRSSERGRDDNGQEKHPGESAGGQ